MPRKEEPANLSEKPWIEEELKISGKSRKPEIIR
jgi:hypothetical protein